MMMAAAKAHYWHQWHILNFYGVSLHTGKFVRNRAALGFGEGMIDLRYHDTLTDAISYAEKTGKGISEARAAREYLDQVLRFCNGDMDRWLTFYNGTPSDWGDDRLFDDWRRQMQRHTRKILAKTGPIPTLQIAKHRDLETSPEGK